MGGATFAVSVGIAWLDLTSFKQYVRFSFVVAVAATVAVYLVGGASRRCARSRRRWAVAALLVTCAIVPRRAGGA